MQNTKLKQPTTSRAASFVPEMYCASDALVSSEVFFRRFEYSSGRTMEQIGWSFRTKTTVRLKEPERPCPATVVRRVSRAGRSPAYDANVFTATI